MKTGKSIKNEQSRDTGNIGYTRHMMKKNKTKSTTQKSKKISKTDPTKNRDEQLYWHPRFCTYVFKKDG